MGIRLEKIVKWFSKKKVLFVVLFFSIALLSIAIILLNSKNKWLKNEYAKQEEYLQQKERFEKLNLYIKTAESESRGYALSGDRMFIENFDATVDSIHNIADQFWDADDSDGKIKNTVSLMRLDTLVQQKIAFMQRVNKLCAANRDSANLLIAGGGGVRLSDSIVAISRYNP